MNNQNAVLANIRHELDALPDDSQGQIIANLLLDTGARLLTPPAPKIKPLALPEKLAYRVPEIVDLIGISRAKIYQLIDSGELRAHKIGTATIITAESLRKFLETLPRTGEEK